MPEMLEIEVYRRAAEPVIGRRIAKVHAPDAWYLKEGLTAPALKKAVEGRTVSGLRRRGKLLLVDTDDGPTIGLRFGMTGRLLVDGAAGIEHLEYSSMRENPDWDRVVFRFD